MRKLKKGVAPSPVNYSLVGKFTHENRDWYVYQRELSEQTAFCNLKVIHPQKLNIGSANLWVSYRMGCGNESAFTKSTSSLNMEQHHQGLEVAIMDFCRERLPETFS